MLTTSALLQLAHRDCLAGLCRGNFSTVYLPAELASVRPRFASQPVRRSAASPYAVNSLHSNIWSGADRHTCVAVTAGRTRDQRRERRSLCSLSVRCPRVLLQVAATSKLLHGDGQADVFCRPSLQVQLGNRSCASYNTMRCRPFSE